jgi:hypothetical protein
MLVQRSNPKILRSFPFYLYALVLDNSKEENCRTNLQSNLTVFKILYEIFQMNDRKKSYFSIVNKKQEKKIYSIYNFT